MQLFCCKWLEGNILFREEVVGNSIKAGRFVREKEKLKVKKTMFCRSAGNVSRNTRVIFVYFKLAKFLKIAREK